MIALSSITTTSLLLERMADDEVRAGRVVNAALLEMAANRVRALETTHQDVPDVLTGNVVDLRGWRAGMGARAHG